MIIALWVEDNKIAYTPLPTYAYLTIFVSFFVSAGMIFVTMASGSIRLG